MSHEIRRLNERLVYQNRFVRVFDDDVEFPGGSTGRYVRLDAALEGNPVVLVVRMDAHIALVRTFRYPLGKQALELPRGWSQGLSIDDTARNELREELGIKDGVYKLLGFLTPDSGLLSARVAVVEVRVTDRGPGPEDTVEVLATEWLELGQIEQKILAGEIEDSFTVAACNLLRLRDAAG